MSGFVDECRKEWKRLGVPEAVSNEMAADLSSDLAEAEAEGASPEEVLGNGIFDARSFAAAWATARGVARRDRQSRMEGGGRRWAVVGGVVLSCVIAAAGLLVIGPGRQGMVAAALAHKPFFVGPFAGPRGVVIGPGGPGRLFFLHGGASDILGLILLLIGFLGLCATLWLWKPWIALRRRPRDDENVGLPSLL
jgi:hypothetical protein